MPLESAMTVIFHYQVTRVTIVHMQTFFSMMISMEGLFGAAFHDWAITNHEMFPHIRHEIARMILHFWEDKGMIFPLSQAQSREHLMSLIAFSQEAGFRPNLNNFQNFFEERSNWIYSTMMNAAYNALQTHQHEWDQFVGPCSDILRQWDNIAALHDNHVATIPFSLAFFTNQDWSILPDNIKWYILNNFPEAALVFDMHFLL